MGQISLSIPTNGLPRSTEEPKVATDLTLIQNVINGNLDQSNVNASAGFVRRVYRAAASNTSAVVGEHVSASAGVTVTLPAPVANGFVSVAAGTAVTGASPVVVSGTNIYGLGLSAASSFKLGSATAFAALLSDGSNWYIVAGQQDTGWAALTNIQAGLSAAAGKYVPAARVVGNLGYLRGGFSGSMPAGSFTLATLPAGMPTLAVGITVVWNGISLSLAASTLTGNGTGTTPPFNLDGLTFSI